MTKKRREKTNLQQKNETSGHKRAKKTRKRKIQQREK